MHHAVRGEFRGHSCVLRDLGLSARWCPTMEELAATIERGLCGDPGAVQHLEAADVSCAAAALELCATATPAVAQVGWVADDCQGQPPQHRSLSPPPATLIPFPLKPAFASEYPRCALQFASVMVIRLAREEGSSAGAGGSQAEHGGGGGSDAAAAAQQQRRATLCQRCMQLGLLGTPAAMRSSVRMNLLTAAAAAAGV
jgi:hypothetical protein